MNWLKKTEQIAGHICTEHLTTVTTLNMLEVREMRHGYLEHTNVKSDSLPCLKKNSISIKVFGSTPLQVRESNRKDEVKARARALLRLNVV